MTGKKRRGGHSRPCLLIKRAQQLMHKLRHHFARQAQPRFVEVARTLAAFQIELQRPRAQIAQFYGVLAGA